MANFDKFISELTMMPDYKLFDELDYLNINNSLDNSNNVLDNLNMFEFSPNKSKGEIIEMQVNPLMVNIGVGSELGLDISTFSDEFTNDTDFALFNSSDLNKYAFSDNVGLEAESLQRFISSSNNIEEPDLHACAPSALTDHLQEEISCRPTITPDFRESESSEVQQESPRAKDSHFESFQTDLKNKIRKFDCFMKDNNLDTELEKSIYLVGRPGPICPTEIETKDLSRDNIRYSLETKKVSIDTSISQKKKLETHIQDTSKCIKVKTIKCSNVLRHKNKVKHNKYPFKIAVKTIKTPIAMVAPLVIPQIKKSLVPIPQISNVNTDRSSCHSSKKIILSKETQINKADLPILNSKYFMKENGVPNGSYLPEPNIKLDIKAGIKRNLTELPFRSLKKLRSNESEKNKQKAYELEPLRDPKLERCRKNAINAKKNRDLKKTKMEDLEREVEIERETNSALSDENDCLRISQRRLQKKVQQLTNLLKDPTKLSDLLQNLQSKC